MTTKPRDHRAVCPECEQRHKRCAEGRKCPRWEMSWEVAALFGELPYTIPPSRNVRAGQHGE